MADRVHAEERGAGRGAGLPRRGAAGLVQRDQGCLEFVKALVALGCMSMEKEC